MTAHSQRNEAKRERNKEDKTLSIINTDTHIAMKVEMRIVLAE
jgi:hypothetical protein